MKDAFLKDTRPGSNLRHESLREGSMARHKL
jgi:hypothetical protein